MTGSCDPRRVSGLMHSSHTRSSTRMPPFSALVLAGGQSSRMGHDKAWISMRGLPLVLRQIRFARKAGAVEVWVSGRRDLHHREVGVRVLHDEAEGLGPIAGVERGLATCRTALLLVLAVDMPCLRIPTLRRLWAASTMIQGAVPAVKGRFEPLAAFYPRRLLPALRSQIASGDFAMQSLIHRALEAGALTVVNIEAASAREFANWNTPTDVARASSGTR